MMDKNENEAYPVDSRAAFSDNLFFFFIIIIFFNYFLKKLDSLVVAIFK